MSQTSATAPWASELPFVIHPQPTYSIYLHLLLTTYYLLLTTYYLLSTAYCLLRPFVIHPHACIHTTPDERRSPRPQRVHRAHCPNVTASS